MEKTQHAVKLGGFKQKRRAETIFYATIVAIPLLQFTIFYVAVNFNSILLAFKEYEYETGAYQWIGFGNFKSFFMDISVGSIVKNAFKNSLVLYFANLLAGTVLALLFSYYVYKKMPLNNFFRTMLFLPSIISGIVLALMFKYFVAEGFPRFFALFGKKVEDPLASLHTLFPTLVFFYIWVGFGTSVLLYSSSMSQISESVVEAAELDGITPVKEFIYITLPLVFPTLTTFLVTGVAGLFINQGSLYTFYKDQADPAVYTVGYYLFIKVIGTSSSLVDYPYAAAAGLVLTAIAAPLTLGTKLGLEKLGPKTE